MEKKPDLKAMPVKKRIEYVWDYYHIPILIGAAILIVITALIVQFVTYKEPIFNVVMINCKNAVDTTAVGYYDFLEEAGIDDLEGGVSLTSTLNFENGESSTIYDRQTLTMLLYAGGQDLFFGTGDIYMEYAKQGVLMDLRKVLSDETLQKYEDSLIYITDEELNETYPCVIKLSDNAWLKKYDYYEGDCYFGIPWNAGNLELAEEFAEYMLNFS